MNNCEIVGATVSLTLCPSATNAEEILFHRATPCAIEWKKQQIVRLHVGKPGRTQKTANGGWRKQDGVGVKFASRDGKARQRIIGIVLIDEQAATRPKQPAAFAREVTPRGEMVPSVS